MRFRRPDVATPQRIVCLTAESAEWLFALGCGDLVAGVTGYAVRPPEVRQKPRVAAFRTAAIERILALKPDLVLGFSDLQADIAAELIRRGANVLVTNQRTLDETFAVMELIARLVGKDDVGSRLVSAMKFEFEEIAGRAPASRPVVFFEEWDEPLISGIAWIGELIGICGGVDAFPGIRGQDASSRIIDPAAVIARNADIVVASWCGKKANLDRIRARPGWDAINAVCTGDIYEIRAPDILQPGPSLIHGARQMAGMVSAWAARNS